MLTKMENLNILKDFIESILKIKVLEIIERPYLNQIYLPKEENFGVIDVRVITEDMKEINVGIQFINGYYIENKILLYYAQIHSKQIEYSSHNSITKTVTINILNSSYFYTNECHSVFNLKSNNDDVLEDNMIEIHVLELPKFKTTKINSKEEAWISFIKGDDILRKECDEIKKFDYILEKYWKSEMIE